MNENANLNIKSAKEWAKNSVGYLAVFFLTAVYTSTALFQLGKSDKDIWQIISEAVTSLLLGGSVARLFSLQGILLGKRSPEAMATAALHGKAVNDIVPWIGRLDAWCEKKTAEMPRMVRMRILTEHGLHYDDYFAGGAGLGYRDREIPDELLPCNEITGRAGRLLENRKRKQLKAWLTEEKRRKRCYLKAERASITPLMSGALTGSLVKTDDPFNFGKNVAEFEVENSRRGAFYRILSAALFGYFGIDLVREFSYEMLFYRLFQVALAVAFGAIQQYRSYLYIVEDKRGNMIKKIDYLQMFRADMEAEASKGEENGYQNGQ